MEKNKTKQIFIYQFNYPFETIQKILIEKPLLEQLYINEEFKIKKFIGSDWSIKGSGFILFFKNNSSITFTLTDIKKNDFIKVNMFRITHFNEIEFNNEINIKGSLIRNTTENKAIMEYLLEYNSENELDKFQKKIGISLIKKIISKVFSKINFIINDSNKNKNSIIIINHSFIIKKYFKNIFNFFKNWKNMAKCIKTDKIWKIFEEKNSDNIVNYNDFYIVIKENLKVHYHVDSIKEIKDEKIEIVYNKTNNSIPALNNYIKFSFFNIEKDLCFFLYETHLPINISSPICQIISHYLYYCNEKAKNFIEKNL